MSESKQQLNGSIQTEPKRFASDPPRLWVTLASMAAHPVRSLVPPWSWKAAAFTAALRALTFFVTNIRSGERVAAHAMLVEAVYAIAAAGLAGAISQQLRKTEPLGATLAVVLVGLPGLFVFGQWAAHKAAHTPHLAGGLFAAFLLTSLSSGFSWYAMRNGAMLGGDDDTTVFTTSKRSHPFPKDLSWRFHAFCFVPFTGRTRTASYRY